MWNRIRIAVSVIAALAAACLVLPAVAGNPTPAYKVLEPIQQDNLVIFPVVAAVTHDTSRFLTLDEGLSSGAVVVAEAGHIGAPLVRRRPLPSPPDSSAQVNRLVLINNSDRPLLLLAGEIVTGGKQDRIVGTDRIVPPQSEPVDLSVFCVEPGRWSGTSSQFGGFAAQMAAPSIRTHAMADRDQEKVWAEVGNSRQAIAAGGVAGDSTSYARTMGTPEAKKEVDRVAEPVSRSYETLIRQLKERDAVGVVVAINGRLEWADLFASEALLQKYWAKLVRSYAAESLTHRAGGGKAPGVEEAQRFLNAVQGEREVSETEPNVYRQTEIQGAGWKVFRLTSLLPKTGFDVHVTKMASSSGNQPMGLMRRGSPVE